MLTTRPQVATRRPCVVLMQDLEPSAILRPSFQQKQSGSGAWARRGLSSATAGSPAAAASLSRNNTASASIQLNRRCR